MATHLFCEGWHLARPVTPARFLVQPYRRMRARERARRQWIITDLEGNPA